MKKVFITRRIPGIARKILSEKFIVHSSEKNEPLPRDRLYKLVEDYDAILSTVSEKFDEEILTNRVNLRVISNYAVGLDNIDLEVSRKMGISVYNTPDVVTNSTADLAFSILLSLVRKITYAKQFVNNNNWTSWDPEMFLGEELHGKTLGIWGFGRIGSAIANRALGFGLKVIYYNHSKVSNHNTDFKSVDLDFLLRESDYLSVNLPLNDKTKGIVDAEVFNLMKKNPIVLNVSRGDIIVTDDLVAALREGKIRGAALDVTSPEPISGNHDLCKFENCIIVPHIGTATSDCRIKMAELAAKNILVFLTES